MTAGDGPERISFFSREGAVFILAGAAATLWPLLTTGGHAFLATDSAVYADQGERIWSVMRDLLSSPREAAAGAGTASPQGSGAIEVLRAQSAGDDSVRSITYAAFVGLLLPLGAFWLLFAQAALVMAALYAVVAPALRALPGLAVTVISGLVLFATPLPTMASYLMPDIFGAVILLFAIRLGMGLRPLDLASRVILVAIAFAAITFHYGNLPMAVALFALAALLRAGRRRAFIAVGAVAGGTVLVAVALNVAIGVAGFGTASVAPKRAPIMLARSIEDGPARWVLEEDCASAAPRYALCEYWGTEIPTNVGAALWNAGGMEHAPPDLYARIRAEEIALLTEAFLTYPARQVGAFAGNAVEQLFRIDARYARPGDLVRRGDGRRAVEEVEGTLFETLRPALGSLHAATYFLALAGLLFLRGYRRAAALVLAGLLLNAAIFGGLSAPVSRYQARVAWAAVAVVAVFLARRFLAEPRASQERQSGRVRGI